MKGPRRRALAGEGGGRHGIMNMFFVRPVLFFGFILWTFLLPSCANRRSLVSGDIVFQDSSEHSAQAVEIKTLTRSHWSHCGIYFERPDGGAVIVDGNGREGPVAWQIWKRRGGGRYAAYRISPTLTSRQIERLHHAADSYDRRPYDLKFAWDDETIYCSELIWKSYRDALGLELGQLQVFSDFDLQSPAARRLIERPGAWQDPAAFQRASGMKVVSPQRILESPLLHRVPAG